MRNAIKLLRHLLMKATTSHEEGDSPLKDAMKCTEKNIT